MKCVDSMEGLTKTFQHDTMYPTEKGETMKKTTYILKYRDFVRKTHTRDCEAKDIVSAMEEAKKFCYVNHITVARLVTPTGKEYYV